jgi:hypothetical protein
MVQSFLPFVVKITKIFVFIGARRTSPRNSGGKAKETGRKGSQRSCSRGTAKSTGS